MNGAQLQYWLTDLHDSLQNVHKSNRTAELHPLEIRKVLRQQVPNTKVLINYLICNYEETDHIQQLIAQLLALYYRLGVSRHFVVQILPSLMYVYLSALQLGQDSLVSVFEMLFVAIYNEEILAEGPGSETFSKRVDQVRIPSIRYPSVYHDPNKLNTFPDIGELRQNPNSAVLCSVQIGPYPAVENLIGENRYVVLARLLKVVSSCLPALALDVVCDALCEVLADVARSGFNFKESPMRQEILADFCRDLAYPDLSSQKRIFAPSYFYVEALTLVNFCIFNGYANAGLRALDAIYQRAVYDISPDVLLVTNSMRDLLSQEDTAALIKEVESKTVASTGPRINGD